jgi:hypothetical protein
MILFQVIAATLIGGASFAGIAFCWIECSRKDELDRRAKREIERASHHAYTHAIQGRRDAA